MNYCPNCGMTCFGACRTCKRHFSVTERSFVTVEEIFRAEEGLIPSIKAVREDLGCGLLKAKKIVDLIRMTDEQVQAYFAAIRPITD